ncbi:MAG: ATP-binding protein [Oligoflexia bacterium]|nr:ATP-binding protein [Oligoflexia bacterium]
MSDSSASSPLYRRLDLQAKIILTLVAVIVPTFLVVTLAENELTKPILEDDLRQVGINTGKTLATEIVSSRLLQQFNAGQLIERRIQEILYTQPSIQRLEVVVRDPVTGAIKVIATNIEEDPTAVAPAELLTDTVTGEYQTDELGAPSWEVRVPIEQKARDPRGPRRLLGAVRVQVSLGVVQRVLRAVWRTTVSAAIFSVVMLILGLSYFLRKTITNDRKLREAETHNLELTEQLHEVQRQLMNTEKLAVMGQLTASFAHEIGTPLNAVGGHVQLLSEEIPATGAGVEAQSRLEIIRGQLSKIESIVKGFLQSTAKPTSQRQLVDLNQLAERTLGIVHPRIESLGVRVERSLDRNLGPVRVVPLDIEQVLLNLINNSLDSLRSKQNKRGREGLRLEIGSRRLQEGGREWAEITIHDTGEGIRKADLPNVLKPFFTTKGPGEGTGLGLTICQQLVRKYEGELRIDSKEGSWTEVTMRIPY